MQGFGLNLSGSNHKHRGWRKEDSVRGVELVAVLLGAGVWFEPFRIKSQAEGLKGGGFRSIKGLV